MKRFPNAPRNKRREFIKSTSVAVLALGVAPTTVAAPATWVGARRRMIPLSRLHCEDFAELMGTSFHVTEPSGALLPLLLAEVEDQNARFGGENFSLQFCGSLSRTLAQGTYEFQHRRLGAFEMFIVPRLGDGRVACYEAVFNRIA
jgi:hypothetical protein